MRLIAWIVVSLGLLGTFAHAGPIKVVTEDTAYSYLEHGKVAGPATEVVEATLQRAGLKRQFSLYPWARAYHIALGEPDVLIYLIARTRDREAQFRWVGEIMRIEYQLYKLRNRADIQVPSLDAAKAYRIGVLRDDVRHQYLLANGFTKIVVAASNNENFRRLLNGQVDMIPMPKRDMVTLSEEAGVEPGDIERAFNVPSPTRLYMAYSRSTDDDTVLRTQAAFEQLQAEGEVTRIMAQPD